MPVLVVRTLVVATALVAIACADDPQPEPLDPAVTLGGGIDSFESITDGDDVFIVQGPQGGFHFFGSVRMQGIDPGDPEDLSDPSNPTTSFTVTVAGSRVDANASNYTQGLDPAAASRTYEMVGRLVILDIQQDDELADTEVVFRVQVTDTRGNSASDQRTLTAVPHPANL